MRIAVVLLLALATAAGASESRLEGLERQDFEQGRVLRTWLYQPSGVTVPERPPASAEGVEVPSLMPIARPIDGWSGCGWFQVELGVADEVLGELLALRFSYHQGASRVFVDGRRIAETGTLANDPAAIVPALRPEPIFFAFETPGLHRVAVFFCNPDAAVYHRVGYPAGFRAHLGSAHAESSRLVADQRRSAGRRGLFPGIYLSFALLHALLYAFRRQARENAYFAGLCVSLATLAFLLPHKQLIVDPRIVFWAEPLMNAAGVGFAAFGILFVHRVFAPRQAGVWRRRILRVAALALAILAVWGVLRPHDALGTIFLAMLLALLEMARTVVVAVLRREPGARIVGCGVLAVAAGFGTGLLANMGVLPPRAALTFVVPFVSVLVLIVSMSVYLSRRFALTQRALEEQLVRVQELSEAKLAEERRTHREQVRRRLLEKEVERKVQELEEARRLQLSMLPQSIPRHPGVEIATHMATATEVGGDYYDFDLAEDGTLTLAIGDATGHGMRAGTMVTATKSLFNALSGDPDLAATIRRSNLALKRMNLRALNMALVLAKLNGRRLRITAAGMPFPMIYRAASSEVESIEIGGMPLGSLRSFPYQVTDVELAPGDVVLFMSDGFPERLDPSDEMLGYEKAGEIFGDAAKKPAAEIVERLVEAGESWAAGRERDDDETFVVVKVLASPVAEQAGPPRR